MTGDDEGAEIHTKQSSALHSLPCSNQNYYLKAKKTPKRFQFLSGSFAILDFLTVIFYSIFIVIIVIYFYFGFFQLSYYNENGQHRAQERKRGWALPAVCLITCTERQQAKKKTAQRQPTQTN